MGRGIFEQKGAKVTKAEEGRRLGGGNSEQRDAKETKAERRSAVGRWDSLGVR